MRTRTAPDRNLRGTPRDGPPRKLRQWGRAARTTPIDDNCRNSSGSPRQWSPGDTVLVHAAAGGVGTFAVQFARAWGATAVGTAGAANHDYLRALGAIPVAHGPGWVERVRAAAPGGIDAVVDTVGGATLADSAELAAEPQRVGTLADYPGARRLGAQGRRTPGRRC